LLPVNNKPTFLPGGRDLLLLHLPAPAPAPAPPPPPSDSCLTSGIQSVVFDVIESFSSFHRHLLLD